MRGSGAIAEVLREELQRHSEPGEPPWTVFDQNLLEQILADHHLPQRLAKFMPENRSSWLTDTMEELFGLHPAAEVLVRQTAETILRLAQLGNVIIIGRGGNVITAGFPHVLHVRLVGSEARRAERLREKFKESREGALAFLRKADEGRRRYVKSYYRADIDDPIRYHLTVNTDLLAPSADGQLIANSLRVLAE